MDDVFRCLADPTRRKLLDLLKVKEPQTLSELVDHIAADGPMTRFGVMKHLSSLEEAGLVVSRKIGREKFHYLNAAPIQELADRWIARFAAPLVQRMADVKAIAEKGDRPMQAPKQIYETFIRASAEAVWAALTDPAQTALYYYGTSVESTLKPGTPFRYLTTEGQDPVMIDGIVLEAAPPLRLVTTFGARWNPDMHQDRPSRVTYEITPMDGMCKLTLTHDDFDGETATYIGVAQGWAMILSGLKTLVETGAPLRPPA